MKLLIITSIKEFENEIKQILKKSNVKTYSYCDVNGFRDSSMETIKANWFATEMNESESVLFYAFVEPTHADTVFEFIGSFNDKQETLSRIHIVKLNVEKSN